MKIRLKLVLTALIVLLYHYTGFTQDIHFTLVDPPKEQTWSGILSMTQDADGYLWFATGEGVYKYDGHHFTQYRHEAANPNSLAANRVEKVLAGKNGMIWIGTLGAGLDRFDPVSNTFTHYHLQSHNHGSLSNDSVTAIIEDHKGILWLGTDGGLIRFNPNTGKFKLFVHNDRDPRSLSNNQVRVVYEDREGTIWVGTGSVFHGETPAGQGGLNKLDQNTGKFTRYMHDAKDPASLTDNRVRVIFEDSRGTFWIGTAGDGLYTMDRKKGTFEHHPYDPAHPEKLSRPTLKKDLYYADDHITFITEDNSGRIWIGTFEGGINVYDPSTKKMVWYGADPASKEKIGTNQFWNAFKTRDGVIWINPWNSPQLYKISPYQNKLPYHFMGEYVFGFVEDADNTLWMATSKGLVHRLNETVDQIFGMNKDPRPGKNAIFYIEKDNENKLWVLTGKGVSMFDPKTSVFTNYHRQPGNKSSLVSDSVVYLKKGRAGKLWVGTYAGLDLMDTKTGTFKHFRLTPKGGGSPSLYSYIAAIETDKDTVTWVGTNYSVNKLDEKTGLFKTYLNNVNVVSLFNDSRNVLWACTSAGPYKYDRNKDNFTYVDIPGGVAYWITEDHEHNFWLNTPTGILKLNLKNNATNFYGKYQGVNGSNLAAGYTRHNGEVLYGDSSGYFAFYPDKLLHRAPVVNVVIDKFLLADIPVLPIKGGLLDKPVAATKEIHLNHNQTTFSFGFNNIDFVGDDKDAPIFYMLENYEGKWRKGSTDQTANYYNVPPGTYTFKVKSINGNGLVTEKEIGLIISPPWWHRWWAYALFTLLASGSIWAFIYYRSYKLLKEKRVLEHKVHIRTEEVMQQKEEIETQRDNLETQRNNLEKTLSELKTTQSQLIQSEKMASLGELTAGIAHEIQNPLNFVNNFSEVSAELTFELKEELKNGNVKEAIELANNLEENLGKIQHHGKRADFIVKGMLQHSRTSTGERQLTNINVLADEFLKLSYHGLRAKDKSFNTEMVTSFDENLPKIGVVQQDIGRVLLNLFNNAFYAVNQRAKTAGKAYKPEVMVSTLTENDHVIIKVKDNGIGIPDSIREKIMQPFFTTKPTGEGTGLGLSLTYDMVVKGHGGNIHVDSAEGEGSEFIITLPLN